MKQGQTVNRSKVIDKQGYNGTGLAFFFIVYKEFKIFLQYRVTKMDETIWTHSITRFSDTAAPYG